MNGVFPMLFLRMTRKISLTRRWASFDAELGDHDIRMLNLPNNKKQDTTVGFESHARIAPFLTVLILLILFPLVAIGKQVVLDAGHSEYSPGATACSGKPEYLYNRELAYLMAQRLIQDGHAVTVNSKGGLEFRASTAVGADLLLSLHHDSVQPQFTTRNPLTGGLCTRKASGFSIFVSGLNVHYVKSLAIAKRLGAALVARGLQPTLHHAEPIPGENRPLLDPVLGVYRFDGLRLLRAADAPAILLEVAVITNPDDEKRASSQSYRNIFLHAVSEIMAITQ